MQETQLNDYDIAIVGIACRFPGASNVEDYWANLRDGIESVTRFSVDEMIASGVPAHLARDPSYVKAAPVIAEAARFDASLFGYSPKDAAYIDPQQRHILELAWAALDDAGYDPHRYEGRIATYAGVALNSYLLHSGLAGGIADDYLPILLGSDKDFLATRVAYKLGLTGPALTVQTACSTSLVALHLACQGLLNQESDMALVGAAAIRSPLKVGHLYEEGSVFTPDGHCKPFDAAANGTIFGSGAAVIAIKRLADAVQDNDHIRAVIKGTAINNDGATKADFTAPSVNMQAEVITEALASADVPADSVSYVEAHGTGTFHGDPIEVEALTRAFRADTDRTSFCGIGSVKSNIGHLDAAAGLASLIKVVLAMEHRLIPPTLHFANPNPQIDFANSPFRVISSPEPWETSEKPRRASITSLGMGGTNAHAVLEEAPPIESDPEDTNPSGRPELLVFSANTDSSVKKAMAAIADHLETNPSVPLRDVSFTLQEGRQILGRRRAILAYSTSEAAEILRTHDRYRTVVGRGKATARTAIMMFPGQGAQFAGMGEGLYLSEPEFKRAIDECAEVFSAELQQDFLSLVFPAKDTDPENTGRQLAQTYVTQPALFAIEVAYARLAISQGVEPVALIGHSIGEYAAATIAGVFDLETAARLVAARGRLMQASPTGSMLAVGIPATQLADKIGAQLDLAVINSVDMSVAAGPDAKIEALKQDLSSAGIEATVLRTSHAFHSRMMQGAAIEFQQIAAQVTFTAPSIPFISNVTGQFITPEQATDPSYWASQIRSTVQFNAGLETLFALAPSVFLELGPGNTLTSFVQQHPGRGEKHLALSASRSAKSEQSDAIAYGNALAGLWTNGYPVSFQKIRQEMPVRRISLPGYQFEGDEHWYKPEAKTAPSLDEPTAASSSGSLMRAKSLDDWFWAETYQLLPLTKRSAWAGVPTHPKPVLILGCAQPLADNLGSVLRSQGHYVTRILDEEHQRQLPRSRETYVDIISEFTEQHAGANTVIYLPPGSGAVSSSLLPTLELVHLAQALSRWDGVRQSHLALVTQGARAPLNRSSGDPSHLMLAATIATIANESDSVSTQHIDCESTDINSAKNIVERLFGFSSNDPVIAISDDGNQWTRRLARVRMPAHQWPGPNQKRFLLFGGFGDIGIALSTFLAKSGVTIGLVSRSDPIPQNHPEPDDQAAEKKHLLVRQLESAGASVATFQADLLDPESVTKCIAAFREQYGVPDYVFHLGGSVDDAPILAKTDDSIRAVMAPKVTGTNHLAAALKDLEQTTLVLFSSISAYQSPAGKVDYATANAYQSSFSNVTDKTISICWPAWRDTAMLKAISNEDIRMQATHAGIDSVDAMQCIGKIVASGLRNVIVSPLDLERLIASEAATKHQTTTVSPQTVSLPAGETLHDRVAEHWGQILGFSPNDIGRDENFFDLGGTSLVAVKLVARLEREFCTSLPVQLLMTAPTIDSIVQELESRKPESRESSQSSPAISSSLSSDADSSGQPITSMRRCLIRLTKENPGSNNPNFFLMHGHGGTLMLYRDLVERMSTNWSVWGLQSLGIDGNATPLRSFEEMAEYYIKEIRQAQPEGPYYLGGNCGGGPLAWEVARQLEHQGQIVGLVVMLDSPHKDYPVFPAETSALRKRLWRLKDRYVAISLLDSAGLPQWKFMGKRLINSAIGTVRQIGIKDIEKYADELRAAGNQSLFDVQQWNRHAFLAYDPKPIRANVVFYSAEHQPLGARPDPTLGYRDIRLNWSRAVVLPGSYHNDFKHLDLQFIANDISDIRNGNSESGSYSVTQRSSGPIHCTRQAPSTST